MTKWLEIAWADEGVAETPGRAASETVLGYFKEVGRSDVTSDEVSWCAAFVGACLARGGVPVSLPSERALLARAYLDVGTPIDTPRNGAIAVFTRGDPNSWTGHVAFVVGWTETTLAILGGNQANRVCVQHFPRDRLLGLRWPEPPVAPRELAAQGSRIAGGAMAQQKDAAKVGGVTGLELALPAPPSDLGLSSLAEKLGAMQGSAEVIEKFMIFAWSKGGWVAGALAAYWLARMAWSAGWIKQWRAQDASTGKTT